MGTGTKVKVLEARAAFGVPAVVDADGYEGLEEAPKNGVSLAATEEEAVNATVELVSDSGRRSSAIHEAWSCVERVFSPAAIAQVLEAQAFGQL